MIDFTKELGKFDFMEMDKSFKNIQNETGMIVETLNTTLKRFGKEQSKANMQMDEILDVLDEEKEKQKNIDVLEKTENVLKEDKNFLVKGMISIVDQFEDMYRYVVKYDTVNGAGQMMILWKNIASDLLTCGIMRIDEINVVFNVQLHVAVQTRYDEEVTEGYVLEVLKSGYKYNDKLLRKAQVVINKKKDQGDVNG